MQSLGMFLGLEFSASRLLRYALTVSCRIWNRYSDNRIRQICSRCRHANYDNWTPSLRHPWAHQSLWARMKLKMTNRNRKDATLLESPRTVQRVYSVRLRWLSVIVPFCARVLFPLTVEETCFRMRIILGVVLIRSLVYTWCVPGGLRSGSGATC